MKRLGDVHTHNTRHKTDLAVTQHRTCIFKKNNFKYQTVKFFNKLPLSLRMITNMNNKKGLKKFLITKCFYSINEFFENL